MSARSKPAERRYFIGGSDARIIMGDDEAALIRLWREKRGEVEPEDLSGNLIVQLGLVTEELNRRWYEANTGEVITDIQKQVRHPTVRWLAATPDGRVQSNGAVFESKFMLPWYFSEEAAAEKYMPQLQHNMWVLAATVGGAVGDHRRRQVGGDQDPCGPALSAPDRHRGAEVLALRGERRAASPVRRRAAETQDRGGTDCRHERIECLGGIRRHFCPHPSGPCRARTGQGRTQKPDARRRQGGDRPWAAGQALEIRRRQLRSCGRGGTRCSGPVNSIASLAAALAKAQAELVNPEKSLVGTIRSDDPCGGERVFRYAPLSSWPRHRAQDPGRA